MLYLQRSLRTRKTANRLCRIPRSKILRKFRELGAYGDTIRYYIQNPSSARGNFVSEENKQSNIKQVILCVTKTGDHKFWQNIPPQIPENWVIQLYRLLHIPHCTQIILILSYL